MSNGAFWVALFAEGEYVSLDSFATELEADAFAKGCQEGASHYGAGCCGAYVLPGEREAMREDEDESEVERVEEDIAARVDVAIASSAEDGE